jgi:hypothetical protein
MSDLVQIVSWALERPCPMRRGEHWGEPEQTNQSLSQLRQCAERINEEDVIDGIWITSKCLGTDSSARVRRIVRCGEIHGHLGTLRMCQRPPFSTISWTILTHKQGLINDYTVRTNTFIFARRPSPL